jgi:hypothetical protein
MKLSTRLAGIALGLLLMTAMAASAHDHGKAAPKKPTGNAGSAQNSCKTCIERRATLDPAQFADTRIYEPEVKPAYEIARKYPALLDRLHCFCECQESPTFKHKTLLTCFTDSHAAGCGICIKEALLAAELKEKGVSDAEIESLVEQMFKTDGHRDTHDHGRS